MKKTQTFYIVPPAGYNSWDHFFDTAPKDTRFRFDGESHFWDAKGRNGEWVSSSAKMHADKTHLRNYTHKGIWIVDDGDDDKQHAEQLTLPQLLALEEFINTKLEEAYERGYEDGRDTGYAEGYDAALRYSYR